MSKPGQYDESPELIRAIQDRMREKAARKAHYNKMMSDPYRWAFEAAPVSCRYGLVFSSRLFCLYLHEILRLHDLAQCSF